MTEVAKFPSIPRLFHGDMVITEKVDGMCCAVRVSKDGEVRAQTRTKLLPRSTDPGMCDSCTGQGFSRWVHLWEDELGAILGPGVHWGEWFGHDINRGYGLKHRQFALFNTGRWKQSDLRLIPSLKVVPTIHTGPFSTVSICVETAKLESNGSAIVPGYMAPEGVIVYLTEAQQYFKYTLKGDQRKRGW